MLQRIVWLFRDEDGVTAAEYAVLLALILMGIIMGIQAVGNSTSGMWANDATKITSAIGGS
jgi:pilus assembly protein Flp/PilA